MPTPSEILRKSIALPCGVTLTNRLAKSAMSESLGDGKTGAPTERLARLYERLGRGGAALLITGNVMISRGARGEPANVVVEDERHLAKLREWASAARAHGADIWMQINHAGRQAPRTLDSRPVAPSAVPMRGFMGAFATPRALTDSDIRDIIRRFGETARVAKLAGFTGVQIHGAHGYLVSQFLSPLTNLRDDDWGGDVARRMRFVLEVARSMRAAVGADFPVSIKLNSADFQRGGFTVEEAMNVARALEAEGLDMLEISGGSYESPAMSGSGGLAREVRESTRLREAYFLEYAQKIRSVTRLPLMLTGGMRSVDVMAGAVTSGAIDIVGMARTIAAEPDLPGGILSGALSGASVEAPRHRIKRIDNLVNLFWHQRQLHRMADGKEPDPTLALRGMWFDALRANFT